VERMRIHVKSLDITPKVTLGIVTAVSVKRCCGRPEAYIEMTIRVPTIAGARLRNTRKLVRDVALFFLDIA
jgi:hypothetical protein